MHCESCKATVLEPLSGKAESEYECNESTLSDFFCPYHLCRANVCIIYMFECRTLT